MTNPQVRAVAGKLTEAQRRYLITMRAPSGSGKWPLTNALRGKGLMGPRPHTFITELGLAVREHLLNPTQEPEND